jgi:hypothetical protein
MIGNALWVAKQHGHSIATMLRAYAACDDRQERPSRGTVRSKIWL